MKFELPELPFDMDALEPHISARTLDFHYSKHHQDYIDKLDKALDDSRREKSLTDIIREAHAAEDAAVFNPAAQVWNHNFYWDSLSPEETQPDSDLANAIERDFGSMEQFREEFTSTAAGEFGSGWAWLAQDPSYGGLRILSTTDAVTPLVFGLTPLLTLDVWEHAYYLDYQHERPRYIEAFLDHMINWDLASSRFQKSARAA